MSGYQPRPDPDIDPLIPISAAHGIGPAPPPPDVGPGSGMESNLVGNTAYAGEESLGKQDAWGQITRPYRRLLSAQAIYRREVFQ